MKVKHPLIFVLFLIAGNQMWKRILNPSISLAERLLWVLLTAGLVLFVSFAFSHLEELDDEISRRRAFQ